ncbi:MAG: hypothetical protein O7F73_02740 [Gammaproteobacteria bacterium]|nr:hypothetical protein [Gammaproteobacteria bacterium]
MAAGDTLSAMYRPIKFLVCAGCLLLLQACGSSPAQEATDESTEPVPEITLNMPQSNCSCEEETQDYTFLEKGFNTLHEREYLESLEYFQRYQRIEKNAVADVEAKIAIAYLSILPDSPIYDSRAARASYRELRRGIQPDWKLHEKIQLMQDSLETFLEIQRQLVELEQNNADLRSELAKRETAIKRLRDLTLGREPEPVE